MTFKVDKLIDLKDFTIFHCKFDTNEKMCQTMVRMQEFYESPKFAGKSFTLEEFKAWYATQNDGKYTYNEDWEGFNLPGHVIESFTINCGFSPLSEEECIFLGTNLQNRRLNEKYYVICTSKNNSAIKHEICHALWYLCPAYRKIIKKYIKEVGALICGPLERLALMGYGENVLLDEFHAYLADGFWCWRTVLGINKMSFKDQYKFWQLSRKINKFLKLNFSFLWNKKLLNSKKVINHKYLWDMNNEGE
jgi:hypothetical protein